MPLTEIQTRVLRLLAAGRNPESYLAGGTVLHRRDDSPRFSEDIDFFHDVADSVAVCAESDAVVLTGAGFSLSWLLRTPTFYRAVVNSGEAKLRLEWAQDSAFRFFPVEPDATCGYRLHDADAAVNKMLALAGREEVRDFVDILHLHRSYLSIGALAWAACGKDPGYSPAFLLEQVARHAGYTQGHLDRLALREPLDLKDLKRRWLSGLEEAKRLVALLPESDVGCLYLEADGAPVAPDPIHPDFGRLRRHFGSVRGAWPTVADWPGDDSAGPAGR